MTTIDIILICYNQEQYIEQALRSIYTQKLPDGASARIIVADDASPDSTLAIIKRLAPESPFPLIFLPEEPNLGISKNYKRSFAATTADYVAILEGDDYWLPNHLKQHIEFLQTHLECSMTMNEYTSLNGTTGSLDFQKLIHDASDYKLVSLRQQIVDGNQLGNLSACVLRGKYLRELPNDLYDMPVADWMLGVMLSQRGDIGIISGSTSVYRYKSDGVWAGLSRWQQHKIQLRYANMYDHFQDGKFHTEWKEFKNNCWCYLRRNWIHFMPLWVQNTWHKIKK